MDSGVDHVDDLCHLSGEAVAWRNRRSIRRFVCWLTVKVAKTELDSFRNGSGSGHVGTAANEKVNNRCAAGKLAGDGRGGCAATR
jgi:hypothetical protein